MVMNPVTPIVLANRYCENCVLRGCEKLLAARDRALEFNERYFPASIDTLFVAESPPTSFCEQPDRYFYASGKVRYGTLFYFTMSTLFEEDIKNRENRDKQHFLNRFKEKFYLIDMAKCPVDKLQEDEKAKAITSCSKYLKDELFSLKFRNLVFIGKGSFKRIEKYLNLNPKPVVLPLPFGSQKNVEDFKNELRRAISSHN